MSSVDPHSSTPESSGAPDSGDRYARPPAAQDGWDQLEKFVDDVHELSQSSVDESHFYRELLEGCVTLLAANGGVVWQSETRGNWRPIHHLGSAPSNDQVELLHRTASGGEVRILQPHASTDLGENQADTVLALAPVIETSHDTHAPTVHAIIELSLSPGSSPAVQQGWYELLRTVAAVATNFHLRSQLRSLRNERELYDQSFELTRRLQRTTQLRSLAYEIANEGRRFVDADRLSLVVKQGGNWKLLAASGADRVEPRADVTKRLQALAVATADWGEPIEYADVVAGVADELPPALSAVLQEHVDESQARRLIAAPIMVVAEGKPGSATAAPQTPAVLVAEQFTNDERELSSQRLVELSALCEPAVRQVLLLDRFPTRIALRWADRWERVSTKLGLTKLAASVAAVVAVVAALVFVRVDFEVEAPATLQPKVERDIFATTNGKVTEVRISHGEQVDAGDVLAVLQDPQLDLDVERVEGEIATTRKRLEAVAVARTDRQVREENRTDKLPLSAEAEQLEKRLASLQTQLQILANRRAALTLRSPIEGMVLTLDVQNLLRTRPVERGQVLFTVADTSAGWRVVADVPQDQIGHVVAARRAITEALPVRIRVAGDTEQTYAGSIDSISTAAVLDTDQLQQESPAFEVAVNISDEAHLEARPGMAAQVRIDCGERAMGYVWLHDVWETVYGWLVF